MRGGGGELVGPELSCGSNRACCEPKLQSAGLGTFPRAPTQARHCIASAVGCNIHRHNRVACRALQVGARPLAERRPVRRAAADDERLVGANKIPHERRRLGRRVSLIDGGT
jgi:hypothetical protein